VLPFSRGIDAVSVLIYVADGIASAIAESFRVARYDEAAAINKALVDSCVGVKSVFQDSCENESADVIVGTSYEITLEADVTRSETLT
jgi:hypothetical protein